MQKQISKRLEKCLKFIGLLFLGNLIFLVAPSLAVSQKMMSEDLPVKVNANDMVYDMDKNTITFTGSVVVIRGDFVMKAAKMQLFIQKEKTPVKNIATPAVIPLTGTATPSIQTKTATSEKNNIEKIEAYDGVTFDYGAQSGSSESAVYEAQKGLLIMQGNPVVREGDNFIRGDTILYYTNEKRSEVIGSGKKRVEAIFSSNK